jgi:hypothetical protein
MKSKLTEGQWQRIAIILKFGGLLVAPLIWVVQLRFLSSNAALLHNPATASAMEKIFSSIRTNPWWIMSAFGLSGLGLIIDYWRSVTRERASMRTLSTSAPVVEKNANVVDRVPANGERSGERSVANQAEKADIERIEVTPIVPSNPSGSTEGRIRMTEGTPET